MLEKKVEGIQVRQIAGFPDYWISSHGSVWSDERVVERSNGRPLKLKGRWLSEKPKLHSYRVVVLSTREKKGVHQCIHRLVALAWIGELPLDKPYVLHRSSTLNEKGLLDNCVLNLYYGTQKDNADDRDKDGRTPKGENHYRWKARIARSLSSPEQN